MLVESQCFSMCKNFCTLVLVTKELELFIKASMSSSDALLIEQLILPL